MLTNLDLKFIVEQCQITITLIGF